MAKKKKNPVENSSPQEMEKNRNTAPAESPVHPDETQEVGETDPEEDEDAPEEGAVNAIAQSSASSNALLRAMMDQNFIEYASYVIKDRAIPDINDGFKPVQRRILWAMFLSDDGSYHKVAGVIGDTMKFHPHGDASIGDALVYLANKELYIDPQGNYGSIITGKAAAAPRYIECRLTALAREVLFNPDITELVDSYDGRNKEPVVLPSKIPTLLIMGADGIAVGTNTKIMPHNFNEVLQAQISYLKGEDFVLYPDFIQGGIMDVSKYEDGLGKIAVRAKLEIDGRAVVVKEIPPTTNTDKLMNSIESAVNKNKIKIATFHDYTAADVDIHLVPIRGYDPAKCLTALYAYTDCQLSISCNPMVIRDNHPRRMAVSEILKYSTDQLVQYLSWELQIECGKCLNRILARTLAQIFIEEGIYKRIEKCKSKESMFTEVRKGLEKFKSEWLPVVQALHENIANGPHIMPMKKEEVDRLEQLSRGIIPDPEIETLVNIPIRRISAFEVDENRQQIKMLEDTLHTAEKNLKRIKAYTIKYLQGLLDKYGKLFPRRTEVRPDGFEKIDMHKVALNNIHVGWDKSNCYIGTSVKSEETVLCNEFDHLLCIERKGAYKIIDIPEKIFIDRLYEFRKYDKNTVFAVVYSDTRTGKVYGKRTCIDKFIKDKDYRICPEHCRLELITPRPNAVYECRIDTPIKARQNQELNLSTLPERSPHAGGLLLFPRKLMKITFVRYLDENDSPETDSALLEVPADAAPVEVEVPEQEAQSALSPAPAAEGEKKSSSRKKSAEIKEESSVPKGVAEKKAPSAEESSDEDWGISQPELGF